MYCLGLKLVLYRHTARLVSPATATTTGFSDHSLLTTRLQCTNPSAPRVIYTYRNFRHMDATAFKMSLRQTASFTAPSSDQDIAAEQQTQDLKAVLERHASLKSRIRRVGSSNMRWITPKPSALGRIGGGWSAGMLAQNRMRIGRISKCRAGRPIDWFVRPDPPMFAPRSSASDKTLGYSGGQ